MNMFANASRLTCAALALALLAGPAAAAEIGEPVLGLQDQPVISLSSDLGASSALVTNVVYDSTNQTVSAATSTTDLTAIYGDQLMVAGGIGEDVSAMKFAAFCSGSSTGALVSATETLRFYDLDNAGAYVGGFTVGPGALPGLLLHLHDDGHRERRADHPPVDEPAGHAAAEQRCRRQPHGHGAELCERPGRGRDQQRLLCEPIPRRPPAGT
ncbi:MAG: hypothetical protein IPH86_15725 [bacterium]|nr:hypothetical protein [bacterium]